MPEMETFTLRLPDYVMRELRGMTEEVEARIEAGYPPAFAEGARISLSWLARVALVRGLRELGAELDAEV